MNDKIKYFVDLDRDTWDKEIKKLEGNQHLCTWNFIKYPMSFENTVNKSFLYYFENKLISAILKKRKKFLVNCLLDHRIFILIIQIRFELYEFFKKDIKRK